MANIVQATIRLLETSHPQDITLRDVARESGHGHRLIVEWFGGKGGLFAAVFDETFRRLLDTGDLFYADVPTRDEVKTAFRIFNYMHLHYPEYVADVRDLSVMAAVRERLTSALGIPKDTALLATQRLSALTIGLALFQDFVGLSDDDVIRMMQDEFRASTNSTLAAKPPNPR